MLVILATLAAAAASTPDAAIGRWQTPTRHGIVDIERCGTSICGTLVTSDGVRANPALRDDHNKNAQLRSRPLRGLRMLENFHWKSGSWAGGTIYNPEDGGTYNATITNSDADHLALKGCIVWPLCKTQNWVRVRVR